MTKKGRSDMSTPISTTIPTAAAEPSPPNAGRGSGLDVEREVRAALDEIGCEALEQEGFVPSLDASLVDELGLDSIEQVELIGIAWERCGLDSRIPTIGDIRTLRDLVERATQELGGGLS